MKFCALASNFASTTRCGMRLDLHPRSELSINTVRRKRRRSRVWIWEPIRISGLTAPTIGPPIRRVHIRIEDESGEPTSFGTPGEIMIGGVSVGLGYANDPENGRFTEIDGVRWYRTGDLGRLLSGW